MGELMAGTQGRVRAIDGGANDCPRCYDVIQYLENTLRRHIVPRKHAND